MNTPALLRDAGCTAAEVKATGAFTRQQMEAGGFPLADAAQLRAGGFTCAEVRQEGFTCAEATAAGYTLLELKEAGYVEGLKVRRRARVSW